MPATSVPSVLVTVGTDHHPFARLISWIDDWIETRPGRVRFLVQHGTAPASRLAADCHALLPVDRLLAAMRESAAVVTHGGPATIASIRRAGRLPIVVARNPRLGEHVDEHQMHFARHLQRHGLAVTADTADALHQLLDRIVVDPSGMRIEADRADTAPAIARFATLVDGLTEPSTVGVAR